MNTYDMIYEYLVLSTRQQLHTTTRVLTSDHTLAPYFAGSVGPMLTSIQEFHESRLLKEAQEVEEAKADTSSRAEAEPKARYGPVQQYGDTSRIYHV